ncbi:MAG: alpha-ketoglutarate-dependent dioxygenase AlkB [Methyloversatilis sp. 12-65-5]|nr:MAG: alpha-ketoglutarate-dependent dioxygenase AlkB [Methyloversatilis sp. 12-65-5]
MELFDALERAAGPVTLAPGAALLRGFALDDASALLAAIDAVAALAPLRHMVTPGGYTMSVATTSCGDLGWTSDAQGYRYAARDPHSDLPWPAMPALFGTLASDAAAQAGFPGFEPDACLINRYAPGARLTLHQDKNERDFGAPIVSVSLGLPATFLLGGIRRTDPTLKLRLVHGDVVVWGGPARLRFHGVLPLAHGTHPLTGTCRVNLTLRKAS